MTFLRMEVFGAPCSMFYFLSPSLTSLSIASIATLVSAVWASEQVCILLKKANEMVAGWHSEPNYKLASPACKLNLTRSDIKKNCRSQLRLQKMWAIFLTSVELSIGIIKKFEVAPFETDTLSLLSSYSGNYRRHNSSKF